MSNQFIDKLAYIFLKGKTILMTRSKGNSTFYIPGGKREAGETDEQALVREVKEELSVELDLTTLKLYGIFTAQAHGKPEGVMVRMSCYQAKPIGEFAISSEIEEMAYYAYDQKSLVGPVDKIIFDDLHQKGLLG